MTNKQWKLVYGPIAWIALAFGTIHVLIMGVKGWPTTHKWPGGMPPITMTSVLIPMLTIFLKLVQMIFCYMVRPNPARKQQQFEAVDNTYMSDAGSGSKDLEEQSVFERRRLYPADSSEDHALVVVNGKDDGHVPVDA